MLFLAFLYFSRCNLLHSYNQSVFESEVSLPFVLNRKSDRSVDKIRSWMPKCIFLIAIRSRLLLSLFYPISWKWHRQVLGFLPHCLITRLDCATFHALMIRHSQCESRKNVRSLWIMSVGCILIAVSINSQKTLPLKLNRTEILWFNFDLSSFDCDRLICEATDFDKYI